jgi:hypothetical protein
MSVYARYPLPSSSTNTSMSPLLNPAPVPCTASTGSAASVNGPVGDPAVNT